MYIYPIEKCVKSNSHVVVADIILVNKTNWTLRDIIKPSKELKSPHEELYLMIFKI